MPGKKRHVRSGLIRQLCDTPYRFDFFQAVRLLLAYCRRYSKTGDRDLLGQVIRFRNSVSLSFPASEIEALEIDWSDAERVHVEEGGSHSGEWTDAPFRQVTLTPSFIGLTGPSGVLPRHYTQHLADREIYYRDSATRAFLDIFNSRAVALFYQSWAKYRLHLQYESDRNNRFLPLVLSFAGMGMRGMRDRLHDGANGVGDESLAFFSAALRERPASVRWFCRVAAEYFNVACHAEEFVGQWLALPEDQRTSLGGGNGALGHSTICGDRVWDRQTKVRLTLGPMRKDQFDDFLPGSTAAVGLDRLFRLMVGATFDCEVRLILDRRDVVPASLGNPESTARLGWNAWCRSREVPSDAPEAAYLICAASTI